MYWNKAVERYTQVIEADTLFYDDIAMDVEKNRETITISGKYYIITKGPSRRTPLLFPRYLLLNTYFHFG